VLEEIERRIAPASLTFTDVDGDDVTIFSSKGTLALGDNVTVTAGQLQSLNLTDAAFQGANITIVAKRDPVLGGDGRVNVGSIDASGRDLGAVKVAGDLGQLFAGSGSPTNGVVSLNVLSLGRFGTSTGAPGLAVNVNGRLGALAVAGDILESLVFADSIGAVTVGGSLIGGTIDQSGSISATDRLGPVTIKGDIVGGIGATSGSVTSPGNLAGVAVNGSIKGGTGFSSGVVFSSLGSVGPVKVRGNIVGGFVAFTGRVFGKTSVASVSVGGSLMGLVSDSGRIHSEGSIGPIKIGGSVLGGSGARSGHIDTTTGSIGAITIGGSLGGGSSVTSAGSGRISSGGSLGIVNIAGDIVGGMGDGSGIVTSGGSMAGVTLGGSLLGGEGFETGYIRSEGPMGAIQIAGNIWAGSDSTTGRVKSSATIASVVVGGSLIGRSRTGSSASKSGEIFSDGAMGPIRIGGDVIGSVVIETGRIVSGSTLASVTIGGSLLGGTSSSTAEILSEGAMGPVKIGGDIVAHGNTGNGLQKTAYIEGQRIASLFVGGSIRVGVDAGQFGINKSASVRAIEDIGPITIKGSLIGSISTDGDPSDGDLTPIIISAGGKLISLPTATSNLAIKSLFVGGRIENAQILAGYDLDLVPVNGDAQIGTVVVGGDWIASRMAAGAAVGIDGIAGTDDDTFLGGGSALIQSKIASVTIKGQALGTVGGGDSFRLMAQKVGSFKVGGVFYPLSSGADNLLLGASGDLRITDAA
jgi:hypothetical protein